jgi:hypothetical protein
MAEEILALTGEPAEKLSFVHVILESFVSVDEDHGNLVVVLASEFLI